MELFGRIHCCCTTAWWSECTSVLRIVVLLYVVSAALWLAGESSLSQQREMSAVSSAGPERAIRLEMLLWCVSTGETVTALLALVRQ